MTVTYTSEVTTCNRFGCFLRLLLRWRGSIYKIIWAELIVFLFLYYVLRLVYIFALTSETQKQFFRNVVFYCDKHRSLIPLSFVLGFYVNLVTTRWWSQYSSIPFPDNLSILVGAIVKGNNEHARIVRRTIVRYACLTFTITLTMMSPKIKRRFPTKGHLIEAGLLTEDENNIMEELDKEFPSYSKYWLPLAWASNLVTKARHDGLIRDDESVEILLKELNLFRSKCGGMLDYDWISIPLVYTQVVTLAVYSYFAVTIVGTQYVDSKLDNIHVYFPFLPVLEFFFYMGWLKVAELLINPFGDDDDDFEVAWMVDRHLQVCYLIVDKIHNTHPKLTRDQYWAKTAPTFLPHTVASYGTRKEYPVPSTQDINVEGSDQDIIVPQDSEEGLHMFQIDGRTKYGSFLTRIFGSGLRNRRRGIHVPLRTVSLRDRSRVEDTKKDNECKASSSNTYKQHFMKSTLQAADNAEFEKLRQKRQTQQRDKILKCVTLLSEKQTDKKQQLIHDIFKDN